ncbi:zinc ribbon domain-containing protein [Variovorax sp. J22R133]|uniref:FmdB family zinc ribbon protein n=1 Tax=Variovorax brevis TaxID=3053503 RepID=UPI002574C4AF|nr:FmdB family zinc ribbon protein [Variovorax sp. J22R133]MDM0112938.1 zinc ribbon domain-containing protein [Variovorax sp. J22R133]
MPIYAYKCAACGHAQDTLQKMSDAPLTVCPACGKAAYSKQLTAAGFQLKGSGWYVTDFREGGNKKTGADKPASETSGDSAAPATPASGADSTPASAPAAAAPAATPAPAPSPTPASN